MRQKSFWLLLLLGVSLLLVLDCREHDRFRNNKLQSSDYWDLTGFPIFIDDDDPSYNWAITAATKDWCSGSGTWIDPYLIENVTINGQNSGSCIFIRGSSVFFVIKNCTLSNSGNNLPTQDSGIRIKNSRNGFLINNTCKNNNGFGISLEDANNCTVLGNTLIYNDWSGIFLDTEYSYVNCDENLIQNNTISHNNDHGVHLECTYNPQVTDVKNNTIKNNFISFNGLDGIRFTGYVESILIIKNEIYNNTQDGFHVNGDYIQIVNNHIFNNTEFGIENYGVSTTIRDGNYFSGNSYGVRVDGHKSIIKNNTFTQNDLYGVAIDHSSDDNKLFGNNFTNNPINAYDDSTTTLWDNGSLGNFWDDYTDVDANDDGIGDTPYDVPPISGSIDNYPIWRDGDDIGPNIVILSPEPNDFLGSIAPSFNITVDDESFVNTTWYTIDNGVSNFTFFTLTGKINQSAWDLKSTELITLKFYANDSLGHIDSNEVMIWKDVDNPIITIEAPVSQSFLGHTPPFYNITILEPNLESWGYTFDNITFYAVTNFTGYFDPLAWQDLDNGTILVTFFAHDLAGLSSYSHLTLRKDIIQPIIYVFSPDDRGLLSVNAPFFNISIDDPNLLEWGYTLDDGLTNFTLYTLEGFVNQTAWDNFNNGSVSINFYARDKAGNIAHYTLLVEKDVLSPEINVITPSLNDSYGSIAPAYEIDITEGNLDTVWYSLDEGITNITITEMQDFIDQEQWDLLTEGQITIIFYANDTLGNLGFVEVDFIKEIPIHTKSIPGYNLLYLVLLTSILSCILVNKKKNK